VLTWFYLHLRITIEKCRPKILFVNGIVCSEEKRPVQEKVCGRDENGTVRSTFYAGAVDWRNTQAGSLNADVYDNDKELLENGAIGSYKRITKDIDRSPQQSLHVYVRAQCACT
jgi:hypothetical protein